MIRYLLAIGRIDTPRRRYLTSASTWLPEQRSGRRFFDRVSMRAEQLKQARLQPVRVRVVRLRERGG